ncbi:hypothetical protein BDC45DRAFT_533470 [Circinella umbellata]|nr:hypothetical protein BDC45DRAFT_533470 [Circinella umbellata]
MTLQNFTVFTQFSNRILQDFTVFTTPISFYFWSTGFLHDFTGFNRILQCLQHRYHFIFGPQDFYMISQDLTGFYSVYNTDIILFLDFYMISQDFTGFYSVYNTDIILFLVHRIFTGFHRFNRILQCLQHRYHFIFGPQDFYMISQDFTGFYSVYNTDIILFLVHRIFTGFHRISQDAQDFFRPISKLRIAHRIFTGFHRILQDFT